MNITVNHTVNHIVNHTVNHIVNHHVVIAQRPQSRLQSEPQTVQPVSRPAGASRKRSTGFHLWQPGATLLGLAFLVGSARAADPVWPWPVPTDPPAITGTFMESRETRFHTGMDVRTNGETGWPVHSPVAGHVVRARCSARGYGLALYIREAGGHTIVFAHLDRFFAPAADRLAEAQAASGNYEQDLAFAEGEIPVMAGQVVALSGQTGTGAPHVHVEVRDGAQRALNPADYFETPDRELPTVDQIRLVATDPAAPLSQTVRESGARCAGRGRWLVEVQATDRTGFAPFPVAPRAISVFIDGTLHYRLSNDALAFDEAGQMRLDQRRDSEGRWYLMDRRAGSTLPGREGPGGAIEVTDQAREIFVVVEDARGQRGEFSCVLLPQGLRTEPAAASLRIEGPLLVAEVPGESELPPLIEGPDGHTLLEVVPGGWRVAIELGGMVDGLWKLLYRGEELASMDLRMPADGIAAAGGDGAPRLLAADANVAYPGGALEVRRTRIPPGPGLEPAGDGLELISHGLVPARPFEFAAEGGPHTLLMRYDGKKFNAMDPVRAGVAATDAFGVVTLVRDTAPPQIGELPVDAASGRVLVIDQGPQLRHGIAAPGWTRLTLAVGDEGSGLPDTGPVVLLDGRPWPVRYDGEDHELVLDWFVAPAPGPHTLEVRAVDLSGRESRRSFELEFRR